MCKLKLLSVHLSKAVVAVVWDYCISWKKEEIQETEERMRRNQRDHEEDKRAKDAEDRGTNWKSEISNLKIV